jgi:hypothetical protein
MDTTTLGHPNIQQYCVDDLKDHLDKNRTYEATQELNYMLQQAVHSMLSTLPDPEAQSAVQAIELSERIDKLEHWVESMQNVLSILQDMHRTDGNHVPTIVTTPAELEALAVKEELSGSSRVVVETSYERAMRALV